MPDTKNNLLNAFAEEAKNSQKYLIYAEKAENEGNIQVARLFRATAEAESIHAQSHLKATGIGGSTEQNLHDAINAEYEEFAAVYPPMIEKAKSDGDLKGESSLQRAYLVEKAHHSLFKQALATMKTSDGLNIKSVFVCRICGNTVSGELTDACTVCGASKKFFFEIK